MVFIMKILSKICSFVLVCALVFTLFLGINVSAASSATISFNKKELLVNEELVATVTINADENMQSLKFVLNYDPSVLQFTSGDSSSGGAGVVTVVHPAGNSPKVTLSYRFKTLKTGNASISMSDSAYVNFDEQIVAVPPQGGSINVKTEDVTLSSNANLKSMYLGAGTLNPAFSPNITTYNVLIPNSATKCLVYATTADPDATLEVEGSSTMKIGANKRVVIVTAPDGTQKSYTLNITRSDVPDEEENTSSTTSSQSNSSITSSLLTSLGTVNYTVATDISSVTLFKGFKASTAKYNGIDVAIATDENGYYKIYYLKSPDSEELVPCLLDNENNTFNKLKYITIGENTYIFEDFPVDKSVSEDYYSATAKVFDYTLSCYANSDTKLADFYYVYCFSEDRFGVYTYDSREKTLQRSPELVLSDISADTEPSKDTGLLARFSMLKANAKIMVVCLIVAIIIAIALIVLLIIKLFHKNDYDDFEDDFEDDEFDSISFDENFVIDSNDNNTDSNDE